MASTALLTDHYELTMLDAALASGTAERPVAFEVFTRSLPPGRRYGVFAGLGRRPRAGGWPDGGSGAGRWWRPRRRLLGCAPTA